MVISCCLATTETRDIQPDMTLEQKLRAVFDPIVKPSMRDSWEKNWSTWFCTTTEVEDQRWPGKLKGLIVEIFLFVTLFFRGVFISARSFYRTVSENVYCIRR